MISCIRKYFSNEIKTFTVSTDKSKSLFLLKGNDLIPFIQSLTTNNINELYENNNKISQRTLFLNDKGRIITDGLLIKPVVYNSNKPELLGNELLVAISNSNVDAFNSHFKKYSFRRNVGLEDVSKYFKISYFYNFISDYFQNIVNEGNIYWDFYKQENMSQTENNSYLDIVFADPDNSNMGLMIISDVNNDVTTYFSESEENKILEDYNLIDYRFKRQINNIFEGSEIVNNLALPLNYDLNGVIKFNKGCYIGQEINNRSNFNGVIRKRAFFYIVLSKKINLSTIDFNFQIYQNYDEAITNYDKIITKDNLGTIFKAIHTDGNTGLALFDYINIKDQVIEHNGLYYHIIINPELKQKIEKYLKLKKDLI